jgi:hypothetical protein
MIRLTARIILFAVALVLLGSLPAPTSQAPASGPYQSALNNLGAGTVWAAKPNKCNSFCEFIAPGFHCLSEGTNTKCSTGTGGCTTVACP